jgi:hypothetical protein
MTSNRTSVSETGHAKNIANFETEIAFCNGYGTLYNPTNPNLKIPNLQAKWETAKLKLKAVKDTKEPFDSVTGARQTVFKILKPLATKVINALVAQEAPETVVKDARTIIRKLNGKRATPANDDPKEQNNISVSQQSYDRLVDSFEQLIVLAETETLYNPNEEDIKIINLKSILDDLSAANTAVRNAFVPYSNAIIERNNELYDAQSGLIYLAFDVKNYVKSVFGAASPQYRQISALVFKKPKE